MLLTITTECNNSGIPEIWTANEKYVIFLILLLKTLFFRSLDRHSDDTATLCDLLPTSKISTLKWSISSESFMRLASKMLELKRYTSRIPLIFQRNSLHWGQHRSSSYPIEKLGSPSNILCTLANTIIHTTVTTKVITIVLIASAPPSVRTGSTRPGTSRSRATRRASFGWCLCRSTSPRTPPTRLGSCPSPCPCL